MILYVFTLAHGLFLGVFLTILGRNWMEEGASPWRLDIESFRNGVLAVAGITVSAFCVTSALMPRFSNTASITRSQPARRA